MPCVLPSTRRTVVKSVFCAKERVTKKSSTSVSIILYMSVATVPGCMDTVCRPVYMGIIR